MEFKTIQKGAKKMRVLQMNELDLVAGGDGPYPADWTQEQIDEYERNLALNDPNAGDRLDSGAGGYDSGNPSDDPYANYWLNM